MTGISKSTLWRLGALGILLPLIATAAPPGNTPAPAPATQPETPATLRDAVALFAQDFDVKVVGLDHVGTEAPNWPDGDLPPAEMLHWILKDYSYAAILKPSATDGRRLPDRLYIIGIDEQKVADGKNKGAAPAEMANADRPPPASLAVWGRQPSAVVRNLTNLASSTGARAQPGTPVGANAQAGAAPVPIVPNGANPAQSAAAMAALTRSAQSSLSSLVTGLRQVCQNPKGC